MDQLAPAWGVVTVMRPRFAVYLAAAVALAPAWRAIGAIAGTLATYVI